MKAATAIGIVAAIVGILGGAMMEGTSPTSFLNMPAMILVFVGTFGATLAACGMDAMKKIPAVLQDRLRRRRAPPGRQGPRARRASPRRPARTACWPSSPTSRRSTTPSPRRACSSSSTAPTPTSCARSWRSRSTPWPPATRRAPSCSRPPAASPRRWASSAPSWASCTCSSNLSAPETLGPSISGAFIATLMGVGAANVVFLPVANRLKGLSHEELHVRNLVARGHPLDPGRRQPARRRPRSS